MEDLIKELEQNLEIAESYRFSESENKTSYDSAMEYAYKYGVLFGAIKSAIRELNYLQLKSQLK